MEVAIKQDSEKLKKRYKESKRHTLQVDFHPYKESIEREIRKTEIV
jgi:dimethylaniline monooxygenase (N-oxide forming)